MLQGHYAVEEMQGGRYMCRDKLLLMMKNDDNSIYFVDDASFKALEGIQVYRYTGIQVYRYTDVQV